MRDIETVYLYTDGSSHPKERTGGWAFSVLLDPEKRETEYQSSGYDFNPKDDDPLKTTNNKMELTAVVNGINNIYNHYRGISTIVVYTDSRYVSDAHYLGWLDMWKENGWLNSQGKPTKNKQLWVEMLRLVNALKRRRIDLQIRWVKGHAGNYHNELCDKMAKEARYSKVVNELYL